ncbi:MAG: nicotinate-nucleotide--dimethylbenzimidazole phosphoribosyltransferase [Candidatus Dactylopiibacterium sp.]|nr:nicotinate-nucleotide--dimethylbenzimidazole phosphoribosyltransferase [Candidatus Dactylopiibacterium sp.]
MIPSFHIDPVSRDLAPALQARLDSRTKPQGSLGRLEALALQAGLIQRTLAPEVHQARLAVFAGDHGAARAGISAFPQEVTVQMVHNFLTGGAAINVLARQHALALSIVDCGMAGEASVAAGPGLEFIRARQGAGTASYLETPAMPAALRDAALAEGARLVHGWHAAGCNAIAFGEMGIGNTSSASLLTHFITGAPLDQVTGRGTGHDDAGLARKRALLEQAAGRVSGGARPDALTALAEFGGFEIATLTGALLAAAECRMLIVVDGFIVTSALLVAHAVAPAVLDYCVFAHGSAEPGHRAQLTHLGAEPLLDLGLRLGEGTGAALAFPLIRSALACLNEMAGFADAGVSEAGA